LRRPPIRSAIYAGSFDPVTLGHVDVIERAARLFDVLVVAVGNNPAKTTWFTLDERMTLVAAAVRHVSNARVTAFSGLLLEAARQEGANVILRGLRAFSDFEIEFRNGLANRDLAGIETLFLLTEPRNIFVSSSLVREIASHGGDFDRYVPAAAVEPIRARARERA
jgi:pantetheine-phosphate adenylyltransferase